MHVLHRCSNDRGLVLQVIYDIMVCAVGETTATFGVPGVMEHCYFMKAGPQAKPLNGSHMLLLPVSQPLQPRSELAAPAGSPHMAGARMRRR